MNESVLITGAATGLGREMALHLAERGFRVYGTTRDARQADDLIAQARQREGALELHEKWPANKAELAGKAGPAARWKTPEEIPALQAKAKPKPAVGRDGCIHCHDVLEGAIRSAKALGEPVPERYTESYPMPQRVGIMLSMKERATVTDIDRNSPAQKAGIQEGDRILRFGGQPVLSWADVQWVLWTADDKAPIKVEIDRNGAPVETQILLPPGWRSR